MGESGEDVTAAADSILPKAVECMVTEVGS